MQRASTVSQTSIRLRGKPIPGAEDRQGRIPGFNQAALSGAHVLCVGAGGINSQIAPTLVRKGVGSLTLLDDDIVEPSNLNRQRFYETDLGQNKALALAKNLQQECTVATQICGLAMRLEDAVARDMNLSADIVICGVDNNPARVLASRYFRLANTPVLFAAVSRDADHGYVFIQDRSGACIGCLFPEITDDDRYPCPGTPAVADILQAVGALVVYGVDTLLMSRPRTWNYRRISLSDRMLDGASALGPRHHCPICSEIG